MVFAVTDEVEVSVGLPVAHCGSDFPPEGDRVHIDVVDATGRSISEYFPPGRLLWVGEDGAVYRGDEILVVDDALAYADHAYLVGRWVGREGDPEVGHDGVGGAQVIVLVDLGVLNALPDAAYGVTGFGVNDVVVESELLVVVVVKTERGVGEHGLDDVAHLEISEELVDVGEVAPPELDEFRVDRFDMRVHVYWLFGKGVLWRGIIQF